MTKKEIVFMASLSCFMVFMATAIFFSMINVALKPIALENIGSKNENIVIEEHLSDTSKNLVLESVPGSAIRPLYMVTEYEIKVSDTIELKSEKDANSSTIAMIPDRVSLLRESLSEDGWVQVTYEGKTGFIKLNEGDMVTIPVIWSKESEFGKLNRATLNKSIGVEAIEFALLQLLKPYEWGAEGPANYDKDTYEREGFDSSGLVQWAYWLAGKNISNTTLDGYQDWIEIKRKDIAVGDLIFFKTVESDIPITHVAMYMGDNVMIHSTQQFMMTTISEVDWDKITAIRRY